MKFNSQICTTKEQSERLIVLGLKKDTADLWWVELENGSYALCIVGQYFPKDAIPAWSLHRLIEMIQEVCPQIIIIYHRVDIRSNVKRIAYSFDVCDNLYDNICDCIEWLIKEGYFNKDHLEE